MKILQDNMYNARQGVEVVRTQVKGVERCSTGYKLTYNGKARVQGVYVP